MADARPSVRTWHLIQHWRRSAAPHLQENGWQTRLGRIVSADGECHSSATPGTSKYPVLCSENPRDLGAPLRNRTVDLLLTISHCDNASLQVSVLTWQNASTR